MYILKESYQGILFSSSYAFTLTKEQYDKLPAYKRNYYKLIN